MNRQRATNCVNLYDDDTQLGNQAIKITGFENPLTATQMEAFSISCWIKLKDRTNDINPIINLTVDDNNMFTVMTHPTGRLYWTYEIGSVSDNDARRSTDANSLAADDTWYHVVFACDEDTGDNDTRVLVYINGTLVDSDTAQTTSTVTASNANSMWIGYESYTHRKFNGQIDDVCVYTKTLTLAEAKRNYNAGKRSHK